MARPLGSGRVPLGVRLRSRLVEMPSGCIEYASPRNFHGYGKISEGGRAGRDLMAHRVAWELANGPIPEGMYVCHKCDNPPCCNVDHLFLGSPADNMWDKVNKGRANAARGEGHCKTPLTENDVRLIRDLYSTGGYSTRQLGERFGISGVNIWKIVKRKSWKHI